MPKQRRSATLNYDKYNSKKRLRRRFQNSKSDTPRMRMEGDSNSQQRRSFTNKSKSKGTSEHYLLPLQLILCLISLFFSTTRFHQYIDTNLVSITVPPDAWWSSIHFLISPMSYILCPLTMLIIHCYVFHIFTLWTYHWGYDPVAFKGILVSILWLNLWWNLCTNLLSISLHISHCILYIHYFIQWDWVNIIQFESIDS